MSRGGDYDNTNSGALFLNDDKKTDKHPDYRGTLNVEGVEYWVSGWKKRSKKGDPYMSLAITEKEERRGRGNGRGRDDSRGNGNGRSRDFDDRGDTRRGADEEIPF